MYIHAHKYIHTYIHTYNMQTYIHTIHMHSCTQAHNHTDIFSHTHIYIYIYIYIHKIFEGILPYMVVAAILVMRSRCHEKNFVPPIQGGFTYHLALIGPAVSEKKMFEHCERCRRKTTDGRRTMGILQAHL